MVADGLNGGIVTDPLKSTVRLAWSPPTFMYVFPSSVATPGRSRLLQFACRLIRSPGPHGALPALHSSTGWKMPTCGPPRNVNPRSPRSSSGPKYGVLSRYPPAVSYTHLRAHETPEHLVCR